MYSSGEKNGWLDRDGKLHPCRFTEHLRKSGELVEKYKLKHTVEYLGWIKVHRCGEWFFGADSYYGRQHIKPTEAQLKWLDINGYDVSD